MCLFDSTKQTKLHYKCNLKQTQPPSETLHYYRAEFCYAFVIQDISTPPNAYAKKGIFSYFMSYDRVCNKRNTQVSQVDQELPTLPEPTSSSPVLSGVHVARSSIFCVMYYKSLFVLPFSFSHCIVSPASI